MSDTDYPLPRGGTTKSERRFKREWKIMKDAIETAFGGTLIAHGPGALIAREGYGSFDLPQWALNALLDYVEQVESY